MSDVTTGKEREGECCVDENDGRHENVECVIRTERDGNIWIKRGDNLMEEYTQVTEMREGVCSFLRQLTNVFSSQHDYLHRQIISFCHYCCCFFTLYALSSFSLVQLKL